MQKDSLEIREFAIALSRLLHLPDVYFSEDDASHLFTSLLCPLSPSSRNEGTSEMELSNFIRDSIYAFSSIVRERKLYRNSKNDQWPESFLKFVLTFQAVCENTGMKQRTQNLTSYTFERTTQLLRGEVETIGRLQKQCGEFWSMLTMHTCCLDGFLHTNASTRLVAFANRCAIHFFYYYYYFFSCTVCIYF